MSNETNTNTANAAIFDNLPTHIRAWVRKVARMNRTNPEDVISAVRDRVAGRPLDPDHLLEIPGMATAYYFTGMKVAHAMNRKAITAETFPNSGEVVVEYLDTLDAINLAQEADTLTYTAADYIDLAAAVTAEERAA